MKYFILCIGLLANSFLTGQISQLVDEKKSDIQNQVASLYSFAKLYGYVRYFHPSDECSAIDWNKFVYHGCEKVLQAEDSVELKKILEEVFSPIAPTISLAFSKNKLEDLSPLKDSNGEVLVSWQHLGIGLNPESRYKSVRLGRIDPNQNWDHGLSKDIIVTSGSTSNRLFKLEARVKHSGTGKGEISLQIY